MAEITKHCIVCDKDYQPDYPSKEAAQNGTAMQREQWISGVCSDICWDKMFPPEEDSE